MKKQKQITNVKNFANLENKPQHNEIWQRNLLFQLAHPLFSSSLGLTATWLQFTDIHRAFSSTIEYSQLYYHRRTHARQQYSGLEPAEGSDPALKSEVFPETTKLDGLFLMRLDEPN